MSNDPKPKHTYRKILVGYEKYNWSDEVLNRHRYDLAMAQHDLDACIACIDTCRTKINHRCKNIFIHAKRAKCDDDCYPENFRGYWGLCAPACKDEYPGFGMTPCPGVYMRKEEIVNLLKE